MTENPTATAGPVSPGTDAETGPGPGQPGQPGQADQVLAEDLLVEEVSIDGMCGVY